ncbi:MAG: aminoacyl-histidine dipeptidase [Acutalibacteraceae bacterium]|jgi:dipeptidase D
MVLDGYEPRRLYQFFEEISAIPRGSGNEAGIAGYLCAFAEKNGLECYRDGLNNVLIKKPAGAGYETHPPVILQGHTDMVCEQNAGTGHDFEREGLRLRVEDGWLSAEGTTLGADDGVAVAIMLALLEDDTLAHPPLECLFTVQEETGMDGAIRFDYDRLAGRTMINLDSESLDVATVSCAGGVTGEMTLSAPRTRTDGTGLVLTLTGLAGGHSGADIHRGRGNAVRLMGRLLTGAGEKTPLRLAAIDGGNKANAIPRECTAAVITGEPDAFRQAVQTLADAIRRECRPEDAGFALAVTPGEETNAFSPADTRRILGAVGLAPNGVTATLPTGGVETSCSLGIVRTAGDTVTLTFMPRSSRESRLDEMQSRLELLAGCLGGAVTFHDRHPGWAYADESRIREIYRRAYRRRFGKDPKIEAIHAGLECGIFSQRLPGLDAVSFGPEAVAIHTPDERLNLRSFADAYALTRDMLGDL